MAVAVSADVTVGATSSRLKTLTLTNCSEAFPASSAALTINAYSVLSSKSGVSRKVTCPD